VFALAAWSQTIQMPDFRKAPPITTLAPGETCHECGRIVSIREIQGVREAAVPSAFRGAGPGSSPTASDRNLVGAVIYLPLSEKGGDRPFVGGVGTPEMRERFRDSAYEIAIRLDAGSLRVVQSSDGARYHVGDKVRLSGVNQIELVTD